MKTRIDLRNVLLCGAFLAVSVQESYSATIVNGSFELGPDPGTSFVILYPGNASIHNWLVVGLNSIDYNGAGQWEASDGVRSIDLSGSPGPGSIEQSFDTVVGTTYKVSFDIAGNPSNDPRWPSPAIKQLRASIESPNLSMFEDFSFDATGKAFDDMGWVTESLVFTANDSSTTLRFSSLTEGAFGPALDNVSVSTVPLPPAAVFLLSGLVGIAGLAKKRSFVSGKGR